MTAKKINKMQKTNAKPSFSMFFFPI